MELKLSGNFPAFCYSNADEPLDLSVPKRSSECDVRVRPAHELPIPTVCGVLKPIPIKPSIAGIGLFHSYPINTAFQPLASRFNQMCSAFTAPSTRQSFAPPSSNEEETDTTIVVDVDDDDEVQPQNQTQPHPVTIAIDDDKSASTRKEVQPIFQKSANPEDENVVCDICNQTFSKPYQLKLHKNIHVMERKFQCTGCPLRFKTHTDLLKHEVSDAHKQNSKPRPFVCSECDIGFRVHGHLAKHLRSRLHVEKLEELDKLPKGAFLHFERFGWKNFNLNAKDCDMALAYWKEMAEKMIPKTKE